MRSLLFLQVCFFFFAMNFPLRTFVVSRKFWLLSFHFHLYQDFLLISYLISSLTHWFFRSTLFNLIFFLKIFQFSSCNWFLVLSSSGWKDTWYDLRSLIALAFHLIPDNFRKLLLFLTYFLKELLNSITKLTVVEFRIITMKFILSFLLMLLKNFVDILNFSSLEVYPRGIFSIIYKWVPSLTHGGGGRGLLISGGIILFDYLYNF